MSFSKKLLLIACVVLGVQVFYALISSGVVAWDAAVYIGMADYIVSGGAIGTWEAYRPPLLPLLHVPGAVFGITRLWAVGLTIVASFGAVFVAYKIGERMKKTAGGWAAIVISVSTLFTSFAVVPTTEVFGVCVFLIAWYVLFVKDKPFWGGVLVALLFALRFPYGLLLPVFGVARIVLLWIRTRNIASVVRDAALYAAGGFLILGLYFASNALLYGSPIAVIIEGANIVREGAFLYDESIYFYALVLLGGAPLGIFALVPVFGWKRIHAAARPFVVILSVTLLILFAYFTSETHKEARYVMPVFAAGSLLAGLGIAVVISEWNGIRRVLAIGLILLCAAGSVVGTRLVIIGFTQDRTLIERFETYNQHQGDTVLSTSPILAAYAPVKIIPAYTTLAFATERFLLQKDDIDHVYINTCDLVECQASGMCTTEYLNAAIAPIRPSLINIQTTSIGSCQLLEADTISYE